ncbi:hypothetical protein PAMP_006103 [Pampus punctatissimus]
MRRSLQAASSEPGSVRATWQRKAGPGWGNVVGVLQCLCWARLAPSVAQRHRKDTPSRGERKATCRSRRAAMSDERGPLSPCCESRPQAASLPRCLGSAGLLGTNPVFCPNYQLHFSEEGQQEDHSAAMSRADQLDRDLRADTESSEPRQIWLRNLKTRGSEN